MRRQCSRNLHQTIAASLVSSGSITCTETIEPEEASIFGIAVRQRRSAAAAICLSALRSPRLARGFFVDFIPAGQQVEFWLRGGGGPVEVCSRRSVAVHVPRFSVRPLHEYRDSRSSGPRRRVLRPCALLRYSRPRGWSRLRLVPSRRRRDEAQVRQWGFRRTRPDDNRWGRDDVAGLGSCRDNRPSYRRGWYARASRRRLTCVGVS